MFPQQFFLRPLCCPENIIACDYSFLCNWFHTRLFIFCQKYIHLIRIHFRKKQHFCRKFRTVILFCLSGKSLYLRQRAQFLGIILAGNIYDTNAYCPAYILNHCVFIPVYTKK